MATKCYTTTDINLLNGSLVENQDGTVSVFIPNNVGVLTPVILTKQCCSLLNTNYTFDVVNQKCLWSTTPTTDCKITDVFKIILNPQGNDGVILNFGSNDNCVLDVSFDYLFKIKCETLNDLLLGGVNLNYSDVNPELNNQIISLQLLIEEQIVNCEKLSNEIALVQETFDNTLYSVSCDFNAASDTNSGISTGKMVSEKLTSFNKTGFGLTSDLSSNVSKPSKTSTPLQSRDVLTNRPNLVSNIVNFCLVESDGLIAWSNIIGSTNYENFINGDSSSYTCDDVTTLINQNTATINNGFSPLIIECDTPFGTKNNLISQLSDLNNQLIICQNQLTFLQNQLTFLQNQYNEELTNSCIRPIDMFESFDITMIVEVLSGSTYQTIYEATDFFPQIGFGSLYEYLINNQNSGFYLCHGPNSTPAYLNLSGQPDVNPNVCSLVVESLVESLFEESGLSGTTNGFETFAASLSNSALTSTWLSHQSIISDNTILSAITNNKIRIGFKINHVCDDICILVDNIKLNKVCTNVDKTSIFVSKSPGFELDRIRDNKKSWLKNTTLVNRDFEILNHKDLNPIRQTNYNVEDDRLVINTKEIDLDVSLASAIVTDVWNYISDNPCILTGFEFCDPCDPCIYKSFQDETCFEFMDGQPYEFMDDDYLGSSSSGCCGDNLIEFDNLLTTPLSSITVVEDFEYIISSELIDAKNRQTISSYPTLKALYHRYMNSSEYCDTISSAFDYQSMDQFAGLIGNYWVDLIEQVIPSTTIWGSVKIYSNTIFDQQKFKYKSYSSLLCTNPFSGISVSSPINGTSGNTENIEVIMTNINPSPTNKTFSTICNQLHIAQMNHGSEFIGTVNILSTDGGKCDQNDTAINECTLMASVIIDGFNVSSRVIGGGPNIIYSWSNGETTPNIVVTGTGEYSLTVSDDNCCSYTVYFTIPTLKACWYSLPDATSWIEGGFDYYDVTGYTYIMSSMVVNGVQMVTSPPTYTLTPSNYDSFASTYANSYTNFVTFLNQAFDELGLTNYKAQISQFNYEDPVQSKYSGFYIIRPENDTFNMYITEIGNLDTIYTQNGIGSGPSAYARGSVCSGITLENGVVVE